MRLKIGRREAGLWYIQASGKTKGIPVSGLARKLTKDQVKAKAAEFAAQFGRQLEPSEPS